MAKLAPLDRIRFERRTVELIALAVDRRREAVRPDELRLNHVVVDRIDEIVLARELADAAVDRDEEAGVRHLVTEDALQVLGSRRRAHVFRLPHRRHGHDEERAATVAVERRARLHLHGDQRTTR